MIASWLANKLAAPILLAVVILFMAATAVQTVRINGISFFGWYAISGFKPMYEALQKTAAKSESNYQMAKGNTDRCYVKLDEQSAKIAADSAESDAKLATASQRLTDAQKKAAALAAKLAAFRAQAPAGATVCARVEDVDKRYLETLP